MSNVVDSSVLKNVEASQPWWKETYGPGNTVPVSGIYRCLNCNKEVTSNEGDPFPPQNHAQHPCGSAIKWKLNVRANTSGSL